MPRAKKDKTDEIVREPVPTKWLKRATPDQIADALLETGPRKSGEVAATLVMRGSKEVARVFDEVHRRAEKDPAGLILQMGAGAVQSLFGGTENRRR